MARQTFLPQLDSVYAWLAAGLAVGAVYAAAQLASRPATVRVTSQPQAPTREQGLVVSAEARREAQVPDAHFRRLLAPEGERGYAAGALHPRHAGASRWEFDRRIRDGQPAAAPKSAARLEAEWLAARSGQDAGAIEAQLQDVGSPGSSGGASPRVSSRGVAGLR